MLPFGESLICQEPQNVDIFEWLIEHSKNNENRDDVKAKVRQAKAVCAECPIDIKDACLEAVGRDFTMGVVAGMTDRERRKLLKKAS